MMLSTFASLLTYRTCMLSASEEHPCISSTAGICMVYKRSGEDTAAHTWAGWLLSYTLLNHQAINFCTQARDASSADYHNW